MTTKEIQHLIAQTQVNKGHSPVIENLSNHFLYECDVLSVSGSGYVYEFEVKISKADYKKDREKFKKHLLYDSNHENMPNYFTYVCPEGLIKAPSLPRYAGLIYIVGDKVEVVRKAPLIHNFKHDLLKLMTKVCRVQAERLYLGGCKLTVKNKGIQERNKQGLIDAGFTGSLLKNALKRK